MKVLYYNPKKMIILWLYFYFMCDWDTKIIVSVSDFLFCILFWEFSILLISIFVYLLQSPDCNLKSFVVSDRCILHTLHDWNIFRETTTFFFQLTFCFENDLEVKYSSTSVEYTINIQQHSISTHRPSISKILLFSYSNAFTTCEFNGDLLFSHRITFVY